MTAAVVTIALVAVLVPACSDSADSEGIERLVDTYEAAVRTFARDAPTPDPPVSSGGRRPVVYMVGFEGDPIGPRVQAEVVSRVVEQIDVRFADDRDEAFGRDGTVRDAGVLIEMGSVPDDGDEFQVDAVWQRSPSERRELAMTFRRDGEEITVTSTTVLD